MGAVVQGIKQGLVAEVGDEVTVGQDVFGGVFAFAGFASDVDADQGRFVCTKMVSDCGPG